MGLLLRAVLRRLCVEAGWSYAVFWRVIPGGDQMQFEWGGGHCESTAGAPGISGFEAMNMLLNEKGTIWNSSEGHVLEHGCRAQDRVSTLVNRIMISQVHVMGDGIVGKAALEGIHQWIFQHDLSDYGLVAKVLAELNQQFLAGIQTIAIIPALPHGVVQLGSTKMVIEDIGFIDYVRNLFEQLGHVPGALMSDTIHSYLNQKVQVHELSAVTTDQTGYVKGNQLCEQHSSFTTLKNVIQACCPPFSQMYRKLTADGLDCVLTQQKNSSTGMPCHHISQQPLECGPLQSQLRYNKPDLRSVKSVQPPAIASNLCSSSLMLLGEQLSSTSCNRSQVFVTMNGDTLHNLRTAHLESSESMFPCCLDCSTIRIHCDGTESTAADKGKLSSSNATEIKSCCTVSACVGIAQGFTTNSSTGNEVLSEGSKSSPTLSKMFQTMPVIRHHGLEQDDLSQDVSVPCLESKERSSCYRPLLGIIQGSLLSSSNQLAKNKSYESGISVDNDSCSKTNNYNINDAARSVLAPALHKENISVSLQATSGDDLFGRLDLRNNSGPLHGSLDDMISQHDEVNAHELCTDAFACVSQPNGCPVANALSDVISCNGISEEANPDQLLDAVISKISSGDSAKKNMDANISCKTTSTKSSSYLGHSSSLVYGFLPPPEQLPGELFGGSKPLKAEATGSDTSRYSMDKIEGCCETNSGCRSQLSIWIGNGQDVKCDSISAKQCNKVGEAGKFIRKRLRPGEKPRPRPKDRQLIQDRLNELREIVPDGAKCTIDALLEKTIKHMLFLQNVTKHAEKLKKTGEPRMTSKEGVLLPKDNFEGGATWAFEVGNKAMACPIIVEDIHPPRQMLVEMLCEEQGLFLEIADFIRGLGLTILKGVMEARNAKIWAHFAVEANRDVTRMEIFLSLVRLLEPSMGSSAVPQGDGEMTHNVIHPPGLLDCLL